MPDRHRWLPLAWAVILATLLLGPALAPGYVLSYDMVWVPDLALGGDALGLGSGLPRAVPSDALVALLDELVPGMLLQKLVLLGSLVGAGAGALRLASGLPLAARLVAVSVVQWNPFVAERLLIGHWPILVTYAVLPWLVLAASRRREDGRLPRALWMLVPLASLSASGGVAAAVALLACAWPTTSRRTRVEVLALVLTANAPWLVSGLLHAGTAATDVAGASTFALDGEGSLPGPLAALGLGGIWNSEVVPASVEGPAGWVFVGLIVGLCALGVRGWRAAVPRRAAQGLVACWLVGWGLAVLSWAFPDALAWLGVHIPGAGLLRDGARLLLLCMPLVVALAAYGAEAVGRLLERAGPLRVTVAGVLVVLPVTLLPDLALGLSGRLDPVAYPAEYADVRSLVATQQAHDGDILLLPFSSYRQPGWNNGRKVLDPLGRYLGRDYVASDELVVSGRTLAGEDPRVAAVSRALGVPDAGERGARLADLGISLVVVDRENPGTVPEVVGEVIHSGPRLEVLRLPGARERAVPTGWRWAMGAAWATFALAVLRGLAMASGEARRRRGRGDAAEAGSRC